MISSRTPEGWFHRCAVCDQEVRVDPSSVPTRDAPCPHCGSLGWFDTPDELHIEGDDVAEATELWEAAGRPQRVVLDFSGVSFMDSAQLGRLIRLHQRLTQAGGRVRLVGLDSEVLDVFRLTKLDQMFGTDSDDEPDPVPEE